MKDTILDELVGFHKGSYSFVSKETDFKVIRIASSPSQLKGIGLEYLMIDGEIIAKFLNGNMSMHVSTSDKVWYEPTQVLGG